MKTMMMVLMMAGSCFGGDGGQADVYGNTDKTKCWWKHQAVWSKENDPITYWERESCAHRVAYPWVYSKPPVKH